MGFAAGDGAQLIDPMVPLVWSPSGLSCAGGSSRPKSGCQGASLEALGRICFQARSACWQNELLCSGGNEESDCQGEPRAAERHPPSLSQPPPHPTDIFRSMTAGQILLGHCISPTSPPASGWKTLYFQRLLEVRGRWCIANHLERCLVFRRSGVDFRTQTEGSKSALMEEASM